VPGVRSAQLVGTAGVRPGGQVLGRSDPQAKPSWPALGICAAPDTACACGRADRARMLDLLRSGSCALSPEGVAGTWCAPAESSDLDRARRNVSRACHPDLSCYS